MVVKKQANGKRRYWLMKSEPTVFSITDLEKARDKTTCWDGVRNYQARNFLRDDIKPGDLVLFYHSNCEPSAIVGIAEVVKAGYPDHTAFDPTDKHYDPRSGHKIEKPLTACPCDDDCLCKKGDCAKLPKKQ